MSKGIISILTASASITSQLDSGVDSVFANVEKQGSKSPCIVVRYVDTQPNDSFSSASKLDDVTAQVIIICDREHTSGAVVGAYDLAQDVRTLLEGVAGTYDNEIIGHIAFNTDSSYQEHFESDIQRHVVEQFYQVDLKRVTSLSPLTVFTATNTTQKVTSGNAITAIVFTVDADCEFTSQGLLDGLTMNGTGVTGTPTADGTFYVIAVGMHGGELVVEVGVSFEGTIVTAILLSQVEYDAIGTPDANTYYLIDDT